MTALHLMVMERTVVTGRAVGVRMAQKATTMGATTKAEDGNGDDGDEESQHSGLGACSTPSSQKADASTEDQTSQAEEPPRKRTGKTGTPPSQPPAKGAKQEKGEEAPP